MGEKEKQTGSRAVHRGEMEEVKAVKRRPLWVACLPLVVRVTLGAVLLPSVKSRSLVLL